VRCPRCRKSIGFEQTSHAACGWRAGTAAPGSPEERHLREEQERASEEQVAGHMAKIGEMLGKPKRLSRSEKRGGVALSHDERVIAKSQEEYDAEVARLRAEDQARAAKLARLRKLAETL